MFNTATLIIIFSFLFPIANAFVTPQTTLHLNTAFAGLTSNNYDPSTQLQAAKKPIDEAVLIYTQRYPSKGEYKTPFFNSWGVPRTDIDGTPTSRSKYTNDSRRIFDIDEKRIRSTFQELAKVYGTEEALQMTNDMPAILAFDKRNFKPTLIEFGKIFGDQEAKEMVMRNPGLLAVKPEDAADADDQTMKFSYIVAKTRPAGPFLLYGTLGLLSIPVVEGISGVPFRANLLKSILSQ
jgi:hypothetical protein